MRVKPGDRVQWPKITIVTPNYNQVGFLEETILSVVNQNYPNLEYIIIDGGSTDGSVEIIKKYQSYLSYWISETDEGLYHALHKGFAVSTGEIMGWINSDDMLHTAALFSVAELLSLKGVEWIQGQASIYDEMGRTVEIQQRYSWSKYRYFLLDYQWIQQESTFWTRALWDRCGGYISTKYKLAGDLELWSRFFKQAKLFTPACLIGGFRTRSAGQASLEGLKDYYLEAESILQQNVPDALEAATIKKIKAIDNYLALLSKSRVLNLFFLVNRLQRKRQQLFEFPGEIYFERSTQVFKLGAG
jgi:hypothetical protein